MSDNQGTVLLISRDEAFVTAVHQQRPPDARLLVAHPDHLTQQPLEPISQCWLDLDPAAADARRLVLPVADRYIYFISDKRRPGKHLPPGLHVRRPCPEAMLGVLWADVSPPVNPGPSIVVATPETLPGWVAEFHDLRLAPLCRKCVQRLPQYLGYQFASLYLYDAERDLLTLAESNHQHPVDLALSLSGDTNRLMVEAARSHRLLHTDNAAAERQARDLPEPVGAATYPDGACLIAPLVSNGELRGVLNLSCTTGSVPGGELPLDAIFAFIARSLHYARDFDRARTEARIDSLTGLYNYRRTLETIDAEIRRSERYGAPLTIILLDLDGLKAVNDAGGHAAGDSVLRHVAGRIKAGLRRFDSAARIGGDEFVVVLPATNATGAEQVARRILRNIRSDAATFRDQEITVTASMGIAQWQPGWRTSELLEAADLAMYEAKRSGRNDIRREGQAAPAPVDKLVAARLPENQPPEQP